MEKYGQQTPPKYDLSKIRNKIAVFMGDIDQLSDEVDDGWLLSEASGLNQANVVYKNRYHLAHVSFNMASDMSYFTRDVVAQIKKFNPLPATEENFLQE